MANISQTVNIEMLEKLPDGTYKRKYPKTRSDTGVTFDEHLADLASQEVGKGADLIGLPDVNNKFTSTTIGGAMNELFTNVSNGKQLVGGAITGVDDSVVIPADPTFQDLANAIGGISTGVKMASGTATVSSSTTYADGISSGYKNLYPITVSGLAFKPTKILAFVVSSPRFGLSTYIKDSNLPYPEVMAVSYHNYTTSDGYGEGLFKADTDYIYATETGFRIAFISSFKGLTAHWFAFGD